MNNGIIEKNSKGELIVYYEYKENSKTKYEEYSLHPKYRYYDGFMEGQQVKFIEATECARHYPEHCECMTNKIYAIVIPDKKKSWIKRLLSKFKRR
jgi:hypothetical protein